MTTAINDVIVIEANGQVRVCAWCVPLVRLMEIHKAHRCSDGLCPACQAKLEREIA